MTRFGTEEEKAVIDALRSEEGLSPYFRNQDGGKYVQELEREFAEYVGVDYAVAVSNGTTALHTAYLACGIKPKDRVVVPAHTFIATASMVLAVGAVPVFADVDVRTYCLDSSYGFTDERAVVPVDLLGYPMDMKPIYEAAKEKKMIVVEDASQALGSYRKRHAGAVYNDCATWSAQQTKNWTAGEGGMITTNDREIARRCKSIRSQGSGYLNDPELTFNFRMTELHAAVGLVQLQKYPAISDQIRSAAAEVLSKMPSGLRQPYVEPGIKHNRYILGCIAAPGFNRKGFVDAMISMGVSRGVPGSVISLGYQEPLYHKPLFAGCPRTACEQAIALSESWVFMDIHRFKSLEELQHDIGLLRV